jgi:hypothetical protein
MHDGSRAAEIRRRANGAGARIPSAAPSTSTDRGATAAAPTALGDRRRTAGHEVRDDGGRRA